MSAKSLDQGVSDCYLLWPMTDDPPIADARWMSEYLKRHENPRCRHLVEPADGPDEIELATLGADVALSFVCRIQAGVIRADLRQVLEPEFSQHLRIGRLSINGAVLADRFTYHDPAPVRLRGGKKSYCWQCRECGQLIYYPMGSWYLLARDRNDAPVCAAEIGGLILNQGLAERVNQTKWKKVRLMPLKVKSHPTDGLPVVLGEVTPEQERRPAVRSNH